MKKLKLEEAYERATKGPLMAVPDNLGGYSIQPVDRANMRMIPSMYDDPLLAHAFNVLPEVVERGLKLLTAAERMGIDTMPGDEFAEFREMCEVFRASLAKASTVEVPNPIGNTE